MTLRLPIPAEPGRAGLAMLNCVGELVAGAEARDRRRGISGWRVSPMARYADRPHTVLTGMWPPRVSSNTSGSSATLHSTVRTAVDWAVGHCAAVPVRSTSLPRTESAYWQMAFCWVGCRRSRRSSFRRDIAVGTRMLAAQPLANPYCSRALSGDSRGARSALERSAPSRRAICASPDDEVGDAMLSRSSCQTGSLRIPRS